MAGILELTNIQQSLQTLDSCTLRNVVELGLTGLDAETVIKKVNLA